MEDIPDQNVGNLYVVLIGWSYTKILIQGGYTKS